MENKNLQVEQEYNVWKTLIKGGTPPAIILSLTAAMMTLLKWIDPALKEKILEEDLIKVVVVVFGLIQGLLNYIKNRKK